MVEIGITVIYCIQRQKLLEREASSAVANYCFWSQKSAFFRNLIDHTVIDITQHGCPQFADIIFPTISCTFVCHKSKYACALQSLYSITQWPHFHIFSPQFKIARFNLHDINVFQMWTWLERIYFLNKQRTKYVSIFHDEILHPHVKIASSSHSVVLNQIQWFILVKLKSHIPKSKVHELGGLCHTLSMHYGRYIRIMSKDVQVFFNKSEWSDLMELVVTCMDRQILQIFRLHEDLRVAQ